MEDQLPTLEELSLMSPDEIKKLIQKELDENPALILNEE